MVQSKKDKIVAFDFDGTACTHDYPWIGRKIGAIPVLKELQENGVKLILFTMRSGQELQAAVGWLESEGIKLFGVNENPEQHTWTTSPKPYYHMLIDDAALAPLIYGEHKRPFVDWETVRKLLVLSGFLPE